MLKYKIALVLILLSIVGYVSYHYFGLKMPALSPKESIWGFVPKNSGFVFSAKNMKMLKKALNEEEVKQNMFSGSDGMEFLSFLNFVDSLISEKSGNPNFTEQSNLIVFTTILDDSTHGHCFLLDLNKWDESAGKEIQLEDFGKTNLIEGNNLLKLQIAGTKQPYFVGKKESVLLVSTLPELIQKSIQVSGSKLDQLDLSMFPAFGHDLSHTSGLNLYIDYVQLFSYFHRQTDSTLAAHFLNLQYFAKGSYLDVNIKPSVFFADGFTSVGINTAKKSFLTVFSKQKGKKVELPGFIPDKTGLLFDYSVSDVATFKKAFYNYLRTNDMLDSIQAVLKKFDADYQYPLNDVVYNWMGSSYGYFYLENPDLQKVVYCSVADKKKAYLSMMTLDSMLVQTRKEKINYKDHSIYHLPIQEFPMLYFGKMCADFPQTYYVFIEDYILFSPNAIILQYIIDEINNDNIWGKSLMKNKLVENLNDGSNITIIAESGRLFSYLEKHLRSKNASDLIRRNPVLKRQNKIVIQYSNINNMGYVNLLYLMEGGQVSDLGFKEELVQIAKDVEKPEAKEESENTQPILGLENFRPYVVESHIAKDKEVFLQSPDLKLHLYDHKGSEKWTTDFKHKITSEVVQIDLYKNRKLQYLFAAGNQIFTFDRNGEIVENYPLKLESSGKRVLVFKERKSKRDVFFVYCENHQIYGFQGPKEKLKQWQPKDVHEEVKAALKHVSVNGKDYIIALTSGGKFYAWDIQGKALKGFPLKFEGTFHQDMSLRKKGESLKNVLISIISEEGALSSFDLTGDVFFSESIQKESGALLKLAISPEKNNWILVEIRKDKIVFFKDVEKSIFEHSFEELKTTNEMKNIEVQYFNFGSEHSLVVIHDATLSQTVLYNSKGKRLITQPLINQQKIDINFSKSKGYYDVFYLKDGSLELVSVRE